jgi:hypothetical protein
VLIRLFLGQAPFCNWGTLKCVLVSAVKAAYNETAAQIKGRQGVNIMAENILKLKQLIADADAVMIGVGYNTPGIIKYSFWQQVYQNKNATYVCLNMEEEQVPKEILDRSIVISGDSAQVIQELVS